MPPVSRHTDLLVTGHGCAPVTILDVPGQNTVIANGLLVARVTDRTIVHIIGGDPCVPHVAIVNVGSATVITSGLPTARIGDSTDLGAMIAGSPNIIAGG